MIVVFAQMSQHQRTDGGIQIDADEIGNHIIRQMALAAHHALLHRPWIRPDFEHFEIVIGFEHQQIRAAQMELDRIRQIA